MGGGGISIPLLNRPGKGSGSCGGNGLIAVALPWLTAGRCTGARRCCSAAICGGPISGRVKRDARRGGAGAKHMTMARVMA